PALILWFVAYASTGLAGVESETLLRTMMFYADNPTDKSLYKKDTDSGQQLFLRQGFIASAGFFRFEVNGYVLANGTSSKQSVANILFNSNDDQHRSTYLERHWHNSDSIDAYVTLDRFVASL